ncbi:MAG: transcription initiation factor IIB [Promethearchaeota archaeon]
MVEDVIAQGNFNICPECGGNIISAFERGEDICEQCGLVVIERNIDFSHSGVRAYNKHEKDKKERNGSPISILVPDISLSTIIDQKMINNPDLKRAVKWNNHISWEKKNMLIAITELKRIAGNLNLPDRIKKGAIRYYKQIFRKNILRGRSIKGMITACLYLACKQEKVPITFQEILEESAINHNIIKKCYKILLQELNIKPKNMDPLSLIPRYIADLGLSIDIEKSVIKLMKKYLNSNQVLGKDPKGICAGAIYLIAKFKKQKVSQKQIAKVVGVTEVTLRSRYKELLDHIGLLF